MTRAEAAALVSAFEARTLPKSEWTHEAHLIVGLWYVMHEPLPSALVSMRERIRAYNEASGVANTATSGYHETITCLFLIAIAAHVVSSESDEFEELLASLLAGPCGDSRFPLRHYSRERLMSPEARAIWLDPDLQPFSSAPARQREVGRSAARRD